MQKEGREKGTKSSPDCSRDPSSHQSNCSQLHHWTVPSAYTKYAKKRKQRRLNNLIINVFSSSFIAWTDIYRSYTCMCFTWIFMQVGICTYNTLECDTYSTHLTHLCISTQCTWGLLASFFLVLTRSLLAFFTMQMNKQFWILDLIEEKPTNLWQIRILIIIKSIAYNPLFYSSEIRSDL